ncbi:anti-sigma B factor antagonist [candidate division KSB3 bacterium]|uniref:Anti-sigma factor antagonist n=1 Tax=candidate division KSB3 bacterium TaxID=2044937 RepID=A0A2G6KI32_9BACT|nr:MAG: anti-sigma B factor antagonist [candidate division KSB3 bacterium]
MTFQISTVNHVTVVEIIGDIGGQAAREIQDHILPQIEDASHILLDMHQVGYMSSAGLRLLLLLYRQVKEKNGHIVLAGVSEEIRDIMAITGFIGHFTIGDTLEEGLHALQEDS